MNFNNILIKFAPALPLYGGVFDWDKTQALLVDLNQRAEDPNLWHDQDAAQKILRQRNALQGEIDKCLKLESDLSNITALIELAEEAEDTALLQEATTELQHLAEQADRAQLEALMSGEADQNDCFLEIHPGAGGTEAQDWAQMLLRMYLRWCESHGYKTEMLEYTDGDEAGIKSATVKILGLRAYGWLKHESGVHRLVRVSPYDANARRHTSFASVWVYPVIDDSIDIVVEEKDLRVDTFRASGAGGQHVNKTESAIRITHIPTNIVVQCQNDRSQHRNRAEAMNMLKARLYELELQKRQAAVDAANATKTEIGWGHQIRSYVLQPYQMVKDTRTNVEKGNALGVLEGDIDAFLEAALHQLR